MTTINYDRPVKDLIAGLDATGHVTHVAHKKTSVTAHHNGGRLSHEGVLEVWKTRPASAHFDIDRYGAVAQYVRVNEYAWAAGNTLGNQRSIHIEMANLYLAPTWQIAEVTWKSSARLAGWLFARVIGARPNASNLFQHEHWRATECAGPYVDKIWPEFLLEANNAYDYFVGKLSEKIPAPPASTTLPAQSVVLKLGSKGEAVSRVQSFLRNSFPAYRNFVLVRNGTLLVADGDYGPQTEAWVKEFQKRAGISSDGRVGKNTLAKMRLYGYRY